MNTTMKRAICAIALLASAGVFAQDKGYYRAIQFRDNDPFVFCRYGMDIPDPCWVPVAPFTGAYIYTPACKPQNYYGRAWNQNDLEGLREYTDRCPHAGDSGEWTGPGDGTTSPTKH